MIELPYSYHTFLFPFLWNDGGRVGWGEFAKVLSAGKRWVETSWFDTKSKSVQIPQGKSQDEWLQDYAAFQYFTESANAVIFNTRGDNVVRCLEYRHDGRSPKGTGKYEITKGTDIFKLCINGIRMHIYDSGVAILILELENTQHRSLEDVNKINEYGRRVNMPFLTLDVSHPVCADKIEILFGEKEFESELYKETLNGLRDNFDEAGKNISLNYVMQPIQKLIDGGGKDNGGYEVTTKEANARNEPGKLFIRPCIDDRMFVCCIAADGEFAERAGRYNLPEREYHYLTDCDLRGLDDAGNSIPNEDTISNELYRFCYVETWMTCRSATMKRELLKSSVYDRWIELGTFHAMTHHSLVCVSTHTPIIDAFLTEYIQLAILVLAQRSTILALSGEAAAVAEGFKYATNITPKQIDDIELLQAKYVKAQNQLLITEATAQEQGVEIYTRMKKQLYIDTNKAELDAQMNNLRDVANISNGRIERKSDDTLNRNLVWLSLAAILLTIIQTVPFIIDPAVGCQQKLLGCAAAIVITGLGAVLLRETMFKKQKKGK